MDLKMNSNDIQELLYKKNIWDGVILDPSKLDFQGWNSDHIFLNKFNHDFQTQVVIDLGVWKGKSTITLAENLKNLNIEGTVIAIDTFLGSPEHFDDPLYERLPGGRPDLYERFINNVLHSELQNKIVPLVQTSICAKYILKRKGIMATYIHIDAAHEYEEVKRDIEEYYELLIPGGIMVCDDYCPGWDGVVRAVDEFCLKNNLEIHSEYPKCFFIKK